MKKTLLTVLISGIIFTSIGATAAYVYTARDINYQPSDENWEVSNVQEAISELKTDVNTITNKVEGIERVYKAGEVELVALVSDDSFYKDSNGKYVLSNSDTGRALIADTSTYKSLASTEECIGEVGVDTAIPFSSDIDLSKYDLAVYTNTHSNANPISYTTQNKIALIVIIGNQGNVVAIGNKKYTYSEGSAAQLNIIDDYNYTVATASYSKPVHRMVFTVKP